MSGSVNGFVLNIAMLVHLAGLTEADLDSMYFAGLLKAMHGEDVRSMSWFTWERTQGNLEHQ